MSDVQAQQSNNNLRQKLQAALCDLPKVLLECGIPPEAVKVEFTLDATKLPDNQKVALSIGNQRMAFSVRNQNLSFASCICIRPCPDDGDPQGCYRC